MQINKSSRHSKITGDFAESLVLYCYQNMDLSVRMLTIK